MLDQVSSLRRTQQKLALLSGENFNVFRILKLESREVRTHSAFLGELLNPAGSHGLKDTFLRLFVEVANSKLAAGARKFPEFNTAAARLVVEQDIGRITADYQQGGRIDIYLESAGEYIFIENKIYAGDQQNQLVRYYAHQENTRLLYLTLDGSPPSEWSTGELKDDQYQLFSYKEDITNWLEKCRQAAAAYPLVRETIVQYQHLINYLTGNTPNDFMKEETERLLLNDYANFESAWYCKTVLEELLVQIEQNLLTELNEAWGQNFVNPISSYLQYSISLGVARDGDGYYYNLRVAAENDQDAPAEIHKILIEVARSVSSSIKSNKYYFAWSCFHATGRGNLNPERLFHLQTQSGRAEVIKAMVAEASDKLKQLLPKIEALNQL